MKIILPAIVILLIGVLCVEAQVSDRRLFHPQSNLPIGSSVIDNLDTVVFDLSQAIIVSNKVSFPVYVLSDETINSLDFSFMYNQNNLLFDSIYSHSF